MVLYCYFYAREELNVCQNVTVIVHSIFTIDIYIYYESIGI